MLVLSSGASVVISSSSSESSSDGDVTESPTVVTASELASEVPSFPLHENVNVNKSARIKIKTEYFKMKTSVAIFLRTLL